MACTTAGRERAGATRAKQMAAHGAFELVDCAYWLEEQFFPAHDQLCREEAALAVRALEGEPLPQGVIEACRAEMEALYARFWG